MRQTVSSQSGSAPIISLGDELSAPPRNRLETPIPSQVQSIEEFLGLPQPHTPDQNLQHFCNWVGDSIYVPPKDNSMELAQAMLNGFGLLASQEKCWQALCREHRSKFSEVRRIELPRTSIRLPQGQLYVTVTRQSDFHLIEEDIPASVQTRLDEFLAGPGKKRGVKVYYLKPLCIEVGNDLVFTSEAELDQAISEIRSEVFQLYRKRYLQHRARKFGVAAVDAILAIPRTLLSVALRRKKRLIDAVHCKAEFERRKQALEMLRYRQIYRTDPCTFEETLALTDTPNREDVINHYVKENSSFGELDRQLFQLASGKLPWFLALSIAAYRTMIVSVKKVAAIRVCDPVFVAEMPDQRGKLLKIGHFDEIDGVMHVEI